MFILRFALQSLITAAATVQLINDFTERRSSDFYGQYWLGLGFEAVSEIVTDEKYTAEFVFMHLNDCMMICELQCRQLTNNCPIRKN